MSKAKKIGFFGAARGSYYARGLKDIDNMEIVAVCDKNQQLLDNLKNDLPDTVQYFNSFDEFIEVEMDAMVLCNYFDEHVPFAIRAMEKGIAILSETTAGGTMKDCVDLVRAVERTGAKYMLAENYPFMRGPQEMKKLYEGGTFGKVIYADGEYVHPMSDADEDAISGEPWHWRRHSTATYYCSHSLAPLMYVTGDTPVTVNARVVAQPKIDAIEAGLIPVSDPAATIVCQTEGGSLFRITGWANVGHHGNWYRLSCQNGGVEVSRYDESQVHYAYNYWCVPENVESWKMYKPEWPFNGEKADAAGHGGGDYWVLYHFGEYLNNDVKPYFDVYKAVTMSAVGILGWRSCLNNGKEYTIPDFRKEEDRKLWENDTLTPFPGEHGEKTLPSGMYEFKKNKYNI